jgi:hypothetical protein
MSFFQTKRTLKTLGIVTLCSLALGCSQQPTKTEVTLPTEPVTIVQPEDSQLNCNQLALKVDNLERQVIEMVNLKQQRERQTFTYTSVVDIALSILSMGRTGAAGHLDRSTLEGFNESERIRVLSLSQRHDHLLNLAKQKQCSFVPKVENLLQKVTERSQSLTPVQSFRQRKQ